MGDEAKTLTLVGGHTDVEQFNRCRDNVIEGQRETGRLVGIAEIGVAARGQGQPLDRIVSRHSRLLGGRVDPQHLAHQQQLAGQRRQLGLFNPVTGVGVILGGEIDLGILPHVAVHRAAGASVFVIRIELHPVTELQRGQAKPAQVIHRERLQTHLLVVIGGRRHHQGIGVDMGSILGLDQHTATDLENTRGCRGEAGVGVRTGAHRIGRQHHAGCSARGTGGGLVAGLGLDGGRHLPQNGQIAADLQGGVLHPCQGLGGILDTQAVAHNRIDRLGHEVDRFPAHGVERQGHPHGHAAGGHHRLVQGLDLGIVDRAHRDVATRRDPAAREQGLAVRQNQVVGNQAADRDRRHEFVDRARDEPLTERRFIRTLGLALALDRGVNLGPLCGQDLHRQRRVQVDAVHPGQGLATDIVAGCDATGRRTPAPGDRELQIGVDGHLVIGLHHQATTHQQHRRGHRGGGAVGQLRLDRTDPGERAAAHLVHGHDETGRGRGQTAFGLVAQLSRDVAARRIPGIIASSGAHTHVAHHGQLSRRDGGQGLRRLLGTQIGAQEGLQAAREHTLCGPPDGVVRQADAGSQTAHRHGGTVVSTDGGQVVGGNVQVAFDIERAVIDCGPRVRQHHVRGNERIQGQAHRTCSLRRTHLARGGRHDLGQVAGFQRHIGGRTQGDPGQHGIDRLAHVVAGDQGPQGRTTLSARCHVGARLHLRAVLGLHIQGAPDMQALGHSAGVERIAAIDQRARFTAAAVAHQERTRPQGQESTGPTARDRTGLPGEGVDPHVVVGLQLHIALGFDRGVADQGQHLDRSGIKPAVRAQQAGHRDRRRCAPTLPCPAHGIERHRLPQLDVAGRSHRHTLGRGGTHHRGHAGATTQVMAERQGRLVHQRTRAPRQLVPGRRGADRCQRGRRQTQGHQPGLTGFRDQLTAVDRKEMQIPRTDGAVEDAHLGTALGHVG